MSDDGILESLDDLAERPIQRLPKSSGSAPGGGILESLDDLADPPARRLGRPTGSAPGGGILESLDDIGTGARRGLARRDLFVETGMRLEHTPSKMTGTVVRFVEGVEVVLKGPLGEERGFDPTPGLFRFEGELVALRAPTATTAAPATTTTASGSVAATDTTAQIAKPSRIWVEGIHDAELIERVWGDDLRYEGIVVEQLEGADDLAGRVAAFGPGDGRRLGILLDHLVEGSKESRIAATISNPDVLILGHPYVDIWQAIRPSAIGRSAWPTVPKGQDWKTGILEQLGVTETPGRFWKQLLATVESWNDVETPLVNAVEQLIDFVTVPGD